MKVTCVPVEHANAEPVPERKKVEVCLSRVPRSYNVVKIKAHAVNTGAQIEPDDFYWEPEAEEMPLNDEYYDDTDVQVEPEEDDFEEEESDEQMTWDGFEEGEEIEVSDDVEADETDLSELADIIFGEDDDDEEEGGATLEEINALFDELEDDVDDSLSEFDDVGSLEDIETDAEPVEDVAEQTTTMYRHFERDSQGDRYETDEPEAEGREVVCLNDAGKVIRACGVIRKGGLREGAGFVDDGVYDLAVAEMFGGKKPEGK